MLIHGIGGGVAVFNRLMSLREPPTAIFSADPKITIGILRRAPEVGMQEPPVADLHRVHPQGFGQLVKLGLRGKSALRAAETRLRKTEEELEGERRESAAALSTAEAELRSARSTLERDEARLETMGDLLRQGIISRRRHENAIEERDASLFRLRTAEATLLAARRSARSVEKTLTAELADARDAQREIGALALEYGRKDEVA